MTLQMACNRKIPPFELHEMLVIQWIGERLGGCIRILVDEIARRSRTLLIKLLYSWRHYSYTRTKWNVLKLKHVSQSLFSITLYVCTPERGPTAPLFTPVWYSWVQTNLCNSWYTRPIYCRAYSLGDALREPLITNIGNPNLWAVRPSSQITIFY